MGESAVFPRGHPRDALEDLDKARVAAETRMEGDPALLLTGPGQEPLGMINPQSGQFRGRTAADDPLEGLVEAAAGHGNAREDGPGGERLRKALPESTKRLLHHDLTIGPLD